MEDQIMKSHFYNYNTDEFSLPPLLVGVAGGSASGKSTLCQNIIEELKADRSSFTVINLDSYYKGLDSPEMVKDYNFDHPDALDWDLAFQNLEQLLNRQTAEVPIYSFVTHARQDQVDIKQPADIILVEGILALYDPRIRQKLNYKIFVHCDDDVRLCRRIIRDIYERGRDVSGILYQYNVFVKCSFDEFVQPTMNYADIVVPSSKPNKVAIRFITQNLKNMMEEYKNVKNYLNQKLIINIFDLCQFFQEFQVDDDTDQKGQSFESKIFIYETDAIERNNFNQQYWHLLSQEFKYQFYWEINKLQIKKLIHLFNNHIETNKIDKKAIEIVDINQIDSKLEGKEDKYALIYQEWITIENFEEIHEKLLLLSSKYNQIFIINLFIHMKRMARLIQDNQQNVLKQKLFIFNAYVMINFKQIQKILEFNCKDKDLELSQQNNFDKIFNKRIHKII